MDETSEQYYIKGLNKMGHWNFRVMEIDIDYLSIVEAYYDSRGDLMGWTEPIDVVGESVEELRQTLIRMLECLDKKIIWRKVQEDVSDE